MCQRRLTTWSAIVILLCGLGVSGCSSDDNGAGEAPKATSTQKIFNGTIPNPTHVTVQGLQGTQEMTISGDVDLNASNPKAIITLGSGGSIVKWVLVDGTLYGQEPGSTTWSADKDFTPQPSPENTSDMKGMFNMVLYLIVGGTGGDEGTVEWFTKNAAMQNVGIEVMDSVECTHWSSVTASQGSADIWVDPDGFDVKIIIAGAVDSAETIGTWEFTNRGKDFTVKAPK